ncbi:MAG: cupin [Gammaproteobacteria bacterium]|jgi:uncharacterized protein YjlB
MQAEDVIAHSLPRVAEFPNNPGRPLLVYPAALPSKLADLADRFEAMFAANGWPPAWRNGIFTFHHWHSNAHEVLGIYSGVVTVQFGGEQGPCLEAGPGDAVVVPAGVAHKRVAVRGLLGVVGAYPAGCAPDHCQPGDGMDYVARIDAVAKPAQDPVFGANGPLRRLW